MLTKQQAIDTITWFTNYGFEEDQKPMQHEITLGCVVDYLCHNAHETFFLAEVKLPTGYTCKVTPEMLQAYVYGEIIPLLTDFEYTYFDMISTFGETDYLMETLAEDVLDCYESGFIDYMGLGYKH